MHSTEFSGAWCNDGNRHRLVHFGGGHNATNYDAVNTFSLDALTWAEDYPPTPLLDMLPGNYDFARGAWLSGSDGGPYPRPAAKHSPRRARGRGQRVHPAQPQRGRLSVLAG
jgi:hypothetical protein